jgi:uncharacterized protein YggE
MYKSLIALLLLIASTLPAQLQPRRPVVRASGEATVAARPDQVKVSVGVTTQARTAQEAAEQNATITNQVLEALRGLVGPTGEIRTTNYSMSPVYGSTPPTRTITGYQANNTVEVTLNNTSLAGRAIDVATGAGATNVIGLRFSLRDPQPIRLQALRQATMQAKVNAEAIATGLGLKVGTVLVAQEGGQVIPFTETRLAASGAGASTPIEVGDVDVRAYVSIEAELVN